MAGDPAFDEYMQACVQRSLALFMYEDARFLAERLVAACPSEHNKYLLGVCYWHCNQPHRTCHLLNGCSLAPGRYLAAVCWMAVKNYQAAEAVLLAQGEGQVPNGAAGLFLLGRICRLTNREQAAAAWFTKALRLDPMMWGAFEQLCALGEGAAAAKATEQGEGTLRQHMQLKQLLEQQRRQQQQYEEQQQQQQQQQQQRAFEEGTENEATPAARRVRAARPGAAPLRGAAPQQQQQQQATPGVSNIFSAMSIDTPPQRGVAAGPAAPAGAGAAEEEGIFEEGGEDERGTPVPLFPSLGGVPSSAGSSGGAARGRGLFGDAPTTGIPTAPVTEPATHPGFGGAGPSTAGAQPFVFGGADGAAAGAGGGAGGVPEVTPHALSFLTPSPGGGAGAPPAVPPKAGAAAAAGGQFPGFNHTLGSAPTTAAPTTDRTPAGMRARGAAARRVGRAAGRLFQSGERGTAAEREPSSTLRRSARLAGARHAPDGASPPSDTPPGTACGSAPAPFATSAMPPARPGAEDRRRPRREAPGAGAPPPPRGRALAAAAAAALQQQQAQQQQQGPGGRAAAAAAAAAGTTPGWQPAIAAAATAAAAGALGAAASPDGTTPTPLPASEAALAAVLRILGPLRRALELLAVHDARGALEALRGLPAEQQHTAEVLCLAGRASTEAVDYTAASASFEAARRADPYRLEGMELYSTVLWHLRKEAELAHLARDALAVDRLAPQAWVAVGNCFSLQRDHAAAAAFFRRAMQLDASCAYAAALAGHEYLAAEDLAGAMAAYRNALRMDGRHYNALYGIGQIFLREEKYGEALAHFQAAARVNPSSSVLACYCGVAAHRLGSLRQALAHLGDAIRIDGRNPLARFQRASVLVDMAQEAELAASAAGAGAAPGGGPVSRVAQQRYAEALEELQTLRGIVPREPSVLFTLGRVHKRLGDTDAALAAFNGALDLAPSSADAAAIKAAIDRLHASDDAEEEGM